MNGEGHASAERVVDRPVLEGERQAAELLEKIQDLRSIPAAAAIGKKADSSRAEATPRRRFVLCRPQRFELETLRVAVVFPTDDRFRVDTAHPGS